MNYKEELLSLFDMEHIYFDESMKNHTSFRTGGKAKVFMTPIDDLELASAIKFCKDKDIKYYVLGNGSNVLVSDKGFDGMVISTEKIDYINHYDTYIEAGTGCLLGKIAGVALNLDLTGFEFASGIPGSLGGAVYMNAGAYDGEMKDILHEVKVLEEDGNIRWLNPRELELSYRYSNVGKFNRVVLAAKIKLTKGIHEEIKAKMYELNTRRKEKQPLEFPSAGSTFKRPQGHFAGKLISDAGLGGYKIGDACVSTKHKGFIINLGNATSNDIYDLIEYVKDRVKEEFDVELEREVKLLGDFK